jgi:hypothetical protein
VGHIDSESERRASEGKTDKYTLAQVDESCVCVCVCVGGGGHSRSADNKEKVDCEHAVVRSCRDPDRLEPGHLLVGVAQRHCSESQRRKDDTRHVSERPTRSKYCTQAAANVEFVLQRRKKKEKKEKNALF